MELAMPKTKSLVCIFALFVAFGFCGMALANNFTGTWSGSWNSVYATSGALSASVTQAGTSLSGTISIYNTDCPGTPNFINRPLTGTVSGNSAQFYTYATCPADGSFNEVNYTNGVLSGNTITGYYYVDSDGDPWDSGTS